MEEVFASEYPYRASVLHKYFAVAVNMEQFSAVPTLMPKSTMLFFNKMPKSTICLLTYKSSLGTFGIIIMLFYHNYIFFIEASTWE
jgi:hypothetical protein